jgi:hypothetical protein
LPQKNVWENASHVFNALNVVNAKYLKERKKKQEEKKNRRKKAFNLSRMFICIKSNYIVQDFVG